MFSSREMQKNDLILPGYFELKVEHFFGATIAVDDAYTIPIEIMSPTEEEFILVKAVRQALETKSSWP